MGFLSLVFSSQFWRANVLQSWCIYLMVCLVFVQQVAVINVGGSFKIYELLAVFLLGIWLIKPSPKIYGTTSFLLFLFFIILPCFSYTAFFFDSDKEGYFLKYPDAAGIIRYNPQIAPFILYFYYVMAWITINTMIGNRFLAKNQEFFWKSFIIAGTLLALYCWYGLTGVHFLHLPDPISWLPDYRKYKPFDSIRFCGLSAEPSIYIHIECWVFMATIFMRHLFKKSTQIFLFILHGLTILMTFSSALLAMVVTLMLFVLLTLPLAKKIRFVVIFGASLLGLILLVQALGLGDLAYYFLVQKISNFITPSTHTLDSGAFRSFTARVGLEIFKEHPWIGVGPGMSVMFMHLYENSMGIVEWGQILRHDSLVENCHSQILAETGVIGYGLILVFFLRFIVKTWRRRKENSIFALGWCGAIMTFLMFASIHPIHSLFFWIPLGMVMNALYHTRQAPKD